MPAVVSAGVVLESATVAHPRRPAASRLPARVWRADARGLIIPSCHRVKASAGSTRPTQSPSQTQQGGNTTGGKQHMEKPIRQHTPHRESSRRGSRCNDLAEVVERSSDFRVKQTAPPTASSCSHRAVEILYYSVIYIYIYVYMYIYIYIYIYIYRDICEMLPKRAPLGSS